VEDLAADGVIYGEVRWAPEQHLRAGLTAPEAVEAVRDGLAEGVAACRARGHEIEVRQLVTAMRQAEPTCDIAELALSYRHDGVAGFDIAGLENGYPPSRFLESFQLLRRESAYYTIHAGEAGGCEYIWEAVQVCGANRIGHGVAIIEDIHQDEAGGAALGDFAAYVLNEQIPLEMCPSSNVQTGAAASISEHPIHHLDRLGFCVTVNPDNRLMSATTLTREFALLAEAFDYSLEDVRRLGINAARSVFAPYRVRKALVARIAAAG
jgi:adenosine deaminase